MKSQLYFPFARYLSFFARIVLKKWRPTVLVVCGSAGKTTTLILLWQLLQKKYSVYYSKKANSAIGIPLNILGMSAHHYSTSELFRFALRAPFACVKMLFRPRTHELYLVEADSDRPNEMMYTTRLLSPSIVVWVSSFATHTENFASVTDVSKEFATSITNNPSLEEAFVAAPIKRFSVLNPNDKRIHYIASRKDTLPYLYPREFGYSIGFAYALSKKMGISKKQTAQVLSEFTFPPGRASFFRGIKKTSIIDSSYNSSPEALLGMLHLLSTIKSKRKIAVLGDMRELGDLSKVEHERVAKALASYHFDHIVLVGPVMSEYVLPILLNNGYSDHTVHTFKNTYQAGVYLKEVVIKRGDALLIKASQNTLFFEIIVEMLLEDESDIVKLCRREAFWEKKRLSIKKDFYDTIASSSGQHTKAQYSP